MPKVSKANRFVVDLGALKLSDEDRRALAYSIQSVVLSHLAGKQPVLNQSIRLLDDDGIAGMFVPDPSKPPAPAPQPGYKPASKSKRGA